MRSPEGDKDVGDRGVGSPIVLAHDIERLYDRHKHRRAERVDHGLGEVGRFDFWDRFDGVESSF